MAAKRKKKKAAARKDAERIRKRRRRELMQPDALPHPELEDLENAGQLWMAQIPALLRSMARPFERWEQPGYVRLPPSHTDGAYPGPADNLDARLGTGVMVPDPSNIVSVDEAGNPVYGEREIMGPSWTLALEWVTPETQRAFLRDALDLGRWSSDSYDGRGLEIRDPGFSLVCVWQDSGGQAWSRDFGHGPRAKDSDWREV